MLLYLLMYCWYIHKGFALLRSRPYNSFRVGNILVRIQVRHSVPGIQQNEVGATVWEVFRVLRNNPLLQHTLQRPPSRLSLNGLDSRQQAGQMCNTRTLDALRSCSTEFVVMIHCSSDPSHKF